MGVPWGSLGVPLLSIMPIFPLPILLFPIFRPTSKMRFETAEKLAFLEGRMEGENERGESAKRDKRRLRDGDPPL